MARRPPRSSSRPLGGQPTLMDAAVRGGHTDAPAPPLAERLRPERLEDIVGQAALLRQGSFLPHAIAQDRLPSLILWGPPGSGKTTLAHVVSRRTRSVFVPFSAVLGGVAEVRQIVAEARERRSYEGRGSIVFVDEIHRFNRAQQDAFLPHVENGSITLIGATTENPSFSVNAAILSRCKVLRLDALEPADVVRLLRRALIDPRGYDHRLEADDEVLELMAASSRGDARRALGLLETSAHLAFSEPSGEASGEASDQAARLTLEHVEAARGSETLLYDKSGEEHYNVISALIKSMRGSDPDAAIYWLMRMLESGDDPLFILRRLLIFASEDVGNADPRALDVAVNADLAFRRMGMPEGTYPIAHACLYLASCPKSNAVGKAFSAAKQAISQHGALPVPKKLRNAVTRLMKQEGYGEGYRYAHDFENHVAPGETYLPDELVGARFYQPSHQGLEQAIGERLTRLRSAAATSGSKPADDEQNDEGDEG